MKKIMKKIVCGCGHIFYVDCFCSPQTRKILLDFQFEMSSNNAKVLLEDKDVIEYVQRFFNACPANSNCPIAGKINSVGLSRMEKKPGGLCPIGLWKKAQLCDGYRRS